MGREGGKKKPLRQPKKSEEIEDDIDLERKRKEAEEKKQLMAARKKAQSGALGVGRNKISKCLVIHFEYVKVPYILNENTWICDIFHEFAQFLVRLSLLGICLLNKEKPFEVPKLEGETDLERKKLGAVAFAPRACLLGFSKNKATNDSKAECKTRSHAIGTNLAEAVTARSD
ncbi:hypothetical protein ACTXT7_014848 [Hymenolepis weldensis]